MLPFQIESVVVCDDLRQEVTGKHILIGVYLGTIGVFSLPTALALTFWVETIPTQSGAFSAQVRVIDANGGVMVRGQLDFELTERKTSIIQIQRVPLQIERYGPIELQMTLGNDEWHTIKKVDIIPASTISANAALPPALQSAPVH